MKKASRTLKSAIQRSKAHRAVTKKRRRFPYDIVAKMWAQNKTISMIAHAIGYVDKDNPTDPFHSVRNFLYRMHKGYKDKKGNVIKLEHRVGRSTLKAAREAGLKGPVQVRANQRAAKKAAA